MTHYGHHYRVCFLVKLYYMARLYLDMELFMDFSIYIKNYSIIIIFFYK